MVHNLRLHGARVPDDPGEESLRARVRHHRGVLRPTLRRGRGGGGVWQKGLDFRSIGSRRGDFKGGDAVRTRASRRRHGVRVPLQHRGHRPRAAENKAGQGVRR